MTELPIDENTPRILIVEDEPKLGQLLIDYLRAASYAPTLISHGDQVLPYVRQTPPDLILLDLMLPGTDGLTLCREIRRFSDIPIVMVTAKIEEIDRLLGLEIGADDYICKPYSPREVVARVKTILRRCKPQRELQQQDAESPLIIDEGRFQASWRGKMLDLTPAEFRLLKTLSHEPGKVFSREQLLNHLYDDYRVVTDRTIDSHIKNLRRKLESLDAEQSFIRAVYGVGYRWEADACRFPQRAFSTDEMPAASFSFSDIILLAGDGVQTRSGNIIPRMVSKLTLSLRPGRHQKIAHTLIGKQHL